MYISQETPEQTHQRLLQVLASARLHVFATPYAFIEQFKDEASPLKPHPNALALVADDAVWSQLVPALPDASEPFKLVRFHFVPKQDNSGFVGWLASHLKQAVGTGVFVICGHSRAQGGIFDYWGCPLAVADTVLAVVDDLRAQGVVLLQQTARVISFDPAYRDAFATLNRQWIEQYFVVEPLDELYLNNPEDKILAAGGEVFFVLEGNRAVGTCAMVQHQPGIFELSKMAVAPEARGRGYGRRLMDAALTFARAQQAETVFLVSSHKLQPALRLYERYGFVHITDLPFALDYERSDVSMIWRDPQT